MPPTTERFKFIMNIYSLMPRPRRHRHIRSSFDYNYWRPCVTCLEDRGEVVLKMEEMESIRLKDHLGMDQREAAELMKVSQPTFHRILAEARRKIGALSFVAAIRIHGGTYEMAMTPLVSFSVLMPAMYERFHTAREDPRTAQNVEAGTYHSRG